MSLGIAMKGPEGIVLAADCRLTVAARIAELNEPVTVYYDNATKLLTFSGGCHRYVGAVVFGNALVANRTPHSYLPEIELELPEDRLTVEEYAKRLSEFFSKLWDKQPASEKVGALSLLVGGYDKGSPYGSVYYMEIPTAPEPTARNPGQEFGVTWGGQTEIVNRIISGYDHRLIGGLAQELGLEAKAVLDAVERLKPVLEHKLPYQILPLQDCIDLALFLIRTTVTAQKLAIGVRGVGGPIEVAVVTRNSGLQFIQQKALHGEGG